jgi:hypothetical protein
MIQKGNPNPRHKSSSYFKTAKGFVFHGAATGDLSNDKIQTCRVCKNQGFPNEPITFQKISGTVLADGTTETVGYRVLDYHSNIEHTHKELFRDLGSILWSKIYDSNKQLGVSKA